MVMIDAVVRLLPGAWGLRKQAMILSVPGCWITAIRQASTKAGRPRILLSGHHHESPPGEGEALLGQRKDGGSAGSG